MIPELELLARLRDLHPPASPSWWPPAPGWWLVGLAAAALVFFALRRAPAGWRRLRLRRRLLRALAASASAAEVSQVLRIAALERFPEAQPAGLHGERWIAFLEARDPGRFAGLREAVTEAPYRPAADAGPLRDAARAWIRAVL